MSAKRNRAYSAADLRADGARHFTEDAATLDVLCGHCGQIIVGPAAQVRQALDVHTTLNPNHCRVIVCGDAS